MKNYINEQWLMELYYYYCNKAKTMTIEQTIDLAEEVDSGRAIQKTIKELPPEKTLDMIAKVWEMAGILVDEKR